MAVFHQCNVFFFFFFSPFFLSLFLFFSFFSFLFFSFFEKEKMRFGLFFFWVKMESGPLHYVGLKCYMRWLVEHKTCEFWLFQNNASFILFKKKIKKYRPVTLTLDIVLCSWEVIMRLSCCLVTNCSMCDKGYSWTADCHTDFMRRFSSGLCFHSVIESNIKATDSETDAILWSNHYQCKKYHWQNVSSSVWIFGAASVLMSFAVNQSW